MFAVRSGSRQGQQPGLTKSQLASEMGVTPRCVEKWCVRGCPRRPDGRFDPKAVRAWHDRTVRQRSDSGASNPTFRYWQTRKVKEQALQERLERRRLESSLISVDAVREHSAQQFARARQVLGLLSDKFLACLPAGVGKQQRQAFREAVAKIVADALAALSDSDAEGNPAEVELLARSNATAAPPVSANPPEGVPPGSSAATTPQTQSYGTYWHATRGQGKIAGPPRLTARKGMIR